MSAPGPRGRLACPRTHLVLSSCFSDSTVSTAGEAVAMLSQAVQASTVRPGALPQVGAPTTPLATACSHRVEGGSIGSWPQEGSRRRRHPVRVHHHTVLVGCCTSCMYHIAEGHVQKPTPLPQPQNQALCLPWVARS